MAEKKTVFTVGVFDYFHIGHLNLFERAKAYGDFLIVAVHNDKLKTKNVEYLYSLEDRVRFVNSIKFVDKVVVYERVDLIIQEVDFDIFVVGPDQNHQYFQKAFEYCRNNGKEIIILDRTEGISSTKLRDHIISLD